MRYVNLGRTGLRVSRVCLGMMSFGPSDERPWALGEEDAEPIVRRAVEGGITFFDTADVYNEGQSEVLTGRILSRLFGTREEYVVATKVRGRTMPGVNGEGLGRKHVLASIDASLERLGLDYVDLYQIHRWDYATPIEETMRCCTRSCARARRGTSARAACTHGGSRRRRRSRRGAAGRRSS